MTTSAVADHIIHVCETGPTSFAVDGDLVIGMSILSENDEKVLSEQNNSQF